MITDQRGKFSPVGWVLIGVAGWALFMILVKTTSFKTTPIKEHSGSISSHSISNFSEQLLKAADEGELIFNKITKKYPSINLEPVIFGWATSDPYLLLTIPKEEWFKLSQKDQINLTY